MILKCARIFFRLMGSSNFYIYKRVCSYFFHVERICMSATVSLTIAYVFLQKHATQGSELKKVIFVSNTIRAGAYWLELHGISAFAFTGRKNKQNQNRPLSRAVRLNHPFSKVCCFLYFNNIYKHRLLQRNRRQDKNLINVPISEKTYGTQECFWLDLGQENLM